MALPKMKTKGLVGCFLALVAPFEPTGDQPVAIEKLVQGVEAGEWAPNFARSDRDWKTFTMAKVIEKVQKPALIIAHNKTMATPIG